MVKGYVGKVEPGEVDDGASCYLQHFPVVREARQTTKVRIVYDSVARHGGINLNHVARSQVATSDDVLLRFRKNPVALVADLTEMFLQVVMGKQDKRYHHFLWRGQNLIRPPEV